MQATRGRFSRSAHETMFTGVAGGLGARWGVDPMLVRIAFVVLTFAGGVGAVAYLVAWSLSAEPSEAAPAREAATQQAVAFGLIVVGTLLVLRSAGLWVGDAVGLPVLVAAGGAALLYVRSDAEQQPAWVRVGGRDLLIEKPSAVRLVAGATLVVVGMGSLVVVQEDLAAIGSVLAAVAVTTAGLGLAFGPLVWRLFRQASDERRDRIRSEERAEMAAHLHDSVLQTLALIQRSAGDTRRTVTLARRQERELRSWLYGVDAPDDGGLTAAVESAMHQVEDHHDVVVDVVVVGDAPMDDRLRAVVGALREAATNAARHSGVEDVSVYVECEPGLVTAFVRDRGRGFPLRHVPPDRRGIADSIRNRVERQGGSVEITTAPGEGCEVQVRMPR